MAKKTMVEANSESSDLVTLCLKVDPKLKHDFKLFAASQNITMKELLKRSFEAYSSIDEPVEGEEKIKYISQNDAEEIKNACYDHVIYIHNEKNILATEEELEEHSQVIYDTAIHYYEYSDADLKKILSVIDSHK